MENLVNQLKAAYAGKKILVTGHNGFKGSWLVGLLSYFGAKVIGISLPISEDSPFNSFHTHGPHSSQIIDIRDFQVLNQFIYDNQPELVFHLAAQSLVLDSYINPRETFEVNIQGTANLLESITKTSCQGVIITTTDKVYRNQEQGFKFKETDELWGHDPYSLSKTGTELVASAWRNLPSSNKCKLVTVRAGNVIGPGDYAKNRLLPDILCGLRNGSETQIRNPDAIRPWQYVLDPLIGYLLVGYKVITNKPLSNSYNFGPTDESFVSVRDLVTKFNSIRPIRFSISQSNVGLESKILKIDSTLAQQELAWRPKTDLETALKYSIELNNSEIESEVVFNHIENYLQDF